MDESTTNEEERQDNPKKKSRIEIHHPLLDTYELVSKLNEGGYGVVIKGRRKSDGHEVAIKFFGYTKYKPDDNWILREISIMRSLAHIQGVVHIEATFNDTCEGLIHGWDGISKNARCRKRYPIIVMEKLSGGDLFDLLHSKVNARESISERDVAKIFRNFALALNNVHNAGMINVDLKLENLMFMDVSTDYALKIIDFGMAVLLWDRHEHYDQALWGTNIFMAPETLLSYRFEGEAVYSRSTDVWQAGCILFRLLTGHHPFGEVSNSSTLINITEARYIRYPMSPLAEDLIKRIFVKKPKERITIEQILVHPWLTEPHASSDRDLGENYRARIKHWAYQKKLKRFLATSWIDVHKRAEVFGAAISDLQSDVMQAQTTAADDQYFIDTAKIRELRQRYIQHLSAISPLEDGQSSPRISARNAIRHAGIEFGAFCQIVRATKLDFLASDWFFAIFDWDGNGTVDYKEFLLTLSSFRKDADTMNAAEFYFEIFDVDGSGTISREELACVLQKLLAEREEEELLLDGAGGGFENLFDDIDVDSDGMVSFPEFRRFLEAARESGKQTMSSSSPMPSSQGGAGGGGAGGSVFGVGSARRVLTAPLPSDDC